MSGVQPCVTNTMPGRSCVIRGEHLTSCLFGQVDEEAKRRGVSILEVATVRVEAGLPIPTDVCKGCLPYPAEHGMLCQSCWKKLEAALGKSVDMITHLRSVERGPLSVDGVRTRLTGSKVIIPESWQRADELWLRLSEVAIGYSVDARGPEPVWPACADMLDGFSATATIDEVVVAVRDLVEWVEESSARVVVRRRGAEAAVKYIRRFQHSLRSFPLTEDPSPIKYLRCRRCGQFSVEDHPPLHYLDPRTDVCSMCGHRTDPQMREWDLRLYREEIEAAIADQAAVAESEGVTA